MTKKIGIDGKPYDPAERARTSFDGIRALLGSVKLIAGEPSVIDAQLNAIADRLASCDAFEAKVERMKKAHAELIAAAFEILDADCGTRRLAAALLGVDAKRERS